MSLSRQVRTLFTVSTLIFTYIIWMVASTAILEYTPNYSIYIISLCAVFFMQYLREKDKKPAFQVLIPFFSAVAINVIIINLYSAECNFLYIFFILIFFNRLENEEINYEMYKFRIKSSLYTLIVLGGVLPLVDKSLAQEVFRFYLIYLISAVIVLRETRKFSSRISDKKSLIVNLAITFSVILLSMDKIYNFLTKIFSYIYIGIDFALTKMIMGMAYIVTYLFNKPLYFIIVFIRKLIARILGADLEITPKVKGKLPDPLEELAKNGTNNVVLFIFGVMLKIIIVIFIVYLISRIFNSYVEKNSEDDEGQLKKEKILREKKNKKNKQGILSKFMKIFKGKIDFRTQILNVYLKFQQKMSDKEIYKPHMTAGQLSSVAKIKIDDEEDINSITSIYNEAKFSDHQASEKNAKIAKFNYESLEKKL